MKSIIFARRNIKESLRDIANLFFLIGLPALLLVFASSLNNAMPAGNTAFDINNFAPATIIFSFSFISLFVSVLVSKDISTSFLIRLFSSPMKAKDYVLGYTIGYILIAIFQVIVLFFISLLYGMALSFNLVLIIFLSIPISLIFIFLGIIIGSLVNDKQAPPISSILVQVVAFTSGMWFSVDLLGEVYKTICYILPFANAVDVFKFALAGEYFKMIVPLIIIFAYLIFLFVLVLILFKKKMKQK